MFMTDGTLIGFFRRVHSKVNLQCRYLTERFVAQRARVWFYSAVDTVMYFQLRAGSKLMSASTTFERFLSQVQFEVDVQ